jgi:hypothetical protein
MVAKKKAAKKAAVKKAVKKPAKKPVKKVTAKKTAPEPKVVQAVTDSTGVVTMKSVDDPGTATSGEEASVKPSVDKDTGVLTMVPQTK